jgi:hypothetical protein
MYLRRGHGGAGGRRKEAGQSPVALLCTGRLVAMLHLLRPRKMDDTIASESENVADWNRHSLLDCPGNAAGAVSRESQAEIRRHAIMDRNERILFRIPLFRFHAGGQSVLTRLGEAWGPDSSLVRAGFRKAPARGFFQRLFCVANTRTSDEVPNIMLGAEARRSVRSMSTAITGPAKAWRAWVGPRMKQQQRHANQHGFCQASCLELRLSQWRPHGRRL